MLNYPSGDTVSTKPEITFGEESDYFFWTPLVMPMIGGPIGAILYQSIIGWHFHEVEILAKDLTDGKDNGLEDTTKKI